MSRADGAADTPPVGDGLDGESGLAPGLYWEVKHSFVSYVVSGAGGGYSMGGGVDIDHTGTFFFPLRRATVEGEAWTVELDGAVRFSGHLGMLSVEIVRPGLSLGPDGGVLTIEDVTAATSGRRITIATTGPADPQRYRTYLVWPPLVPLLAAGGVAVFGDVYPEGTPLDLLRVAIPAV